MKDWPKLSPSAARAGTITSSMFRRPLIAMSRIEKVSVSAVPKAAEMMIVLSMTPTMMSAVMPGRREIGRSPILNITVLRSAIPITTSMAARNIPERTIIRTGIGMPNSFSITHLFPFRGKGQSYPP